MFGRLIGLLSLTAVAAMATAGPQNYAQRVQNIRCGVVILTTPNPNNSSQPLQSAGPYALYNLDSNTTIKPTGWNFYNPYAPTVVTSAIQSRWSTIDSAGTAVLGTKISKRNAAYWEVFLNQMTDQNLGNYDLLLVNPYSYASLSPTEQMRLRRFVDNGGILWIDPAGLADTGSHAYMDQFNNFPFAFLPTDTNSLANQFTDFSNPLMNVIQMLTPNDISILDAPSSTSYTISPVNFSADVTGTAVASLQSMCGSDLTDYARLQTISYLGNSNATIALGRIGDGVVVITSRGASIKLNRTAGDSSYNSNYGFTGSMPLLGQDGLSAAKLAVNMVGLLSTWRQPGGGSRKTSGNALDLNPPLLLRSTIPGGNQGFSNSLASNTQTSQQMPALYKGLLVTTDNNVVSVYDANPVTDLDGDGNPDDGVQDYSLGAPYDMIWQSQPLNGPLSAPVCTEVLGGAAGYPQDQVLVVDSQGNLIVFNLTPKNPADGTLLGSPTGGFSPFKIIPPPSGTSVVVDSAVTGVPMAPVIHEGIAYVASIYQKQGVNNSMIWQVDLQTDAPILSTFGTGNQFVLGGNLGSVTLPEYTYSPTVGYIPIQDNSGGVDKVLYAPFAANQSAGINAAGISSIWLGAKGEVPVSATAENGVLQVETRASNHGTLPIYLGSEAGLGPKLTLIDQNGYPVADNLVTNYVTGLVTTGNSGQNGELDFALTTAGTAAFNATPPTYTVRVDYTIDWGNNAQNTAFSIERGRLLMPDVAQNPQRQISGGVALSPQGTAYVVSSTEPANPAAAPSSPYGGGLYGFREQGVGVFNCVARYELFGPNTITLNQTGSASDGGVLFDQDGLLAYLASPLVNLPSVANLLSQTMGQYSIRGGPTIRNGQVFVEASAIKSGGVTGSPTMPIPITILMAFAAEPQTPTFVIGDLPDGSQILQPDFARSTNPSVPENQSTLLASSNGGNGYIYDPTTGVISFPSLMSNSNGQIQNCLSLSQPIIIRKPGAADYVVYPDAIGGAVWNPLQWYTIIDGSYPSGAAPVATGNSVFVSLNSYLPSVLANNFSAVPNANGALYAVNAQIPATQLHPTTIKPWLNQLWTVDYSAGLFTGGDPNILWPQSSSVTSFSDYKIKLNQTLLTSSPAVYGIAGGDNALVAIGSNGVYTYAKSNFMICDEGRLIEMDPSGNPIWSTDTSVSAGQSSINASGNIKPMIRPVRAYLLDQTDILVADPGANRVAKVNTTGIESRSITNFRLDPSIVPAGYQAGESLTLSGPRDALYYTSYALMSQAGGLVSPGDGENANSYEYWQHYLIADTGNKRLVEVIDRFYYSPSTGLVGQPVTVNNVPQVGVLLWHSPAAASGAKYAYTNVSRVKFPDANGGHFVYISGVGGTLPTRVGTGLDAQTATSLVDAQDGSGGIVVYDPANPQLVATFNQITTPDVSGTAFWDPNTQQFDNTVSQTSLQYVQRKGGTHTFTNLNSVSAKIVTDASNNPLVAIMVADGTGVYEATYSPSLGQTQALNVDWMMPNEVFRVIQQTGSGTSAQPAPQNAQDCRALYAKRLDSGEVMIVNGYYGSTIGAYPYNGTVGATSFTGEVLQVNGIIGAGGYSTSSTNLGFNSTSITLDLRTAGATGLRGLVMPVFADRR